MVVQSVTHADNAAAPYAFKDACTVATTAQPAEEKRHHRTRLLSLGSVPAYLHVPHIHRLYRFNISYGDALKGVFSMHNQTFNIWTHLVGFLYFFWIFIGAAQELQAREAPVFEQAVTLLYLMCAQFQMLASALYHTLASVSPASARTWLKIDVCGIIAMVFGSTMMGLFNGFACSPMKAASYIGVLAALLGTTGVVSLIDMKNTALQDSMRNGAFAVSVSFGIVPCGEWFLTVGRHLPWEVQQTVVLAAAGMFGFYGLGFLFFVTRMPERFFPRRFDLVGASHQIWHVFVWAAGAAWCSGMLEFAAWRHAEYSCPAA